MQTRTNLGMSLGQALAGVFGGNDSFKQKGVLDGMRANELRSQIELQAAQRDKAIAETQAKQQEASYGTDDNIIKTLVSGMQNGINGDNVANDFKSYVSGSYHPREQQGAALPPGSYMPPPEYVSKFPELQQKFSGLKQMLALGDKNLPNLPKALQGEQRNAITANVGGMTPQQVADTAAKVSLFESNPNPLEVQKSVLVGNISKGLGTPEISNALTEASGKGLYNNSAHGTYNVNTGSEKINTVGNSTIAANNALEAQRNSAVDLNAANTLLTDAKTKTEKNKTGGDVPTLNQNGQPYSTKPLPTPALKMQQEELETIGTVSGTNADLAAIQSQIKNGALELGTFRNYLSGAKNYMGMSDESSQNFATLQATLEKARNSSLLLNKGVQTDGDAQRAWNELLSNINDPKVVEKRLSEIQSINERAVKIRKAKLSNLRKNYNAPPLDYSEFDAPNTSVQNGSKNKSSARTVVRTGIYQGRKVVQYNDGSTEFAE